ncbi:Crp/Fnr family transcriptional regulator [Postechiella marina]|uniref:Crp/Fnr family transcriptional regulator n=1 Tax=Postechiella marina TaxID=943941 RepID=A0ABP8BYB4_9FLAO
MPTIKYNNLFSIVLLNSISPLSREVNKFLSNKLVCKQYKKGDFLVRNGDMCDRLHVIRKGLIRGYFNYEDKEVTTWVSVDNEFVTSISGYFKKEPALENIQCLEDTFTESISYDDMRFAIENFKEMSKIHRVLLEEYYVQAEHRSFIARIPTAIGRYEHFLKISNSQILDRLPKKYLASLLNMRPETLSRLNKQLV